MATLSFLSTAPAAFAERQRRLPDLFRRPDRLTLTGGVLAVAGGLGHLAISTLMRRQAWAGIADQGFRRTVSLTPTAAELPSAEAFWFGPGSFGAPLVLLGSLVVRLARQGVRIPGWLGSGIVAWATLLGVFSGFDAGNWIITAIGALLWLGDRPVRSGTVSGPGGPVGLRAA